MGSPSLTDWAEYLRRHGGFHTFGQNCAINPSTYFADPYLTSIGNNVRIAGGLLYCHDGSINMINRACGTTFDSVGPIIIDDDVFIGVGTIILPGVHIGRRSIIGAGSVVARKVPPNSVVVGSPAKVVRKFDDHVAKMRQRHLAMPWHGLVDQRASEYDAEMEPELRRQRVKYYFNQ